MRFLASSVSGTTQPRWILALVGLALLFVIGIVLLRKPTPPPEPPSPPEVTELSRTNLVLTDGRLQEAGTETPFTGIMIEHYADGTQRSRSVVSNGMLNGLSQGYHTNGQMQVSEHFVDGTSHGTRTKWYPDGTKLSEADIVNGKLHGRFQRWHENGQLSERIDFVEGQPEGESLSFFPSGYLKARVVTRDGKQVEQKFWKDGEQKPDQGNAPEQGK